ncbi:cb-type cytochrome C oxidase subunit IV [Corynebacterium rhinophilum]|uniref:cb-type cytochrome C oxidase subunit IV n=2 Tax=Corynebacterium rhinophilum TaxID=3050197 RepID=UPI00254E39F0|nr:MULTISPECIES: cb-type cytochrome C oxidase subunit IV [unclassified Corynebacterium]MDK8492005.1 cb-type cytochrome C oxidase subunit IV [Corynebacterium sp. MSK175]MDK8452852.1 cb-type cytochrome C oxidase subunit IV [Corynebacterium sp. MSK084]MDK8467300.1 cb-type cytochrome C oxidase subunit IV [Corynebacterium sp. MSK130]MDK8514792.1 cb-type cytochrome C oxidase subunit IV [Corynebacterium sp. MSK123]MDK8548008.1 cb-type cytochrome C oxidase subunit IV [Corynebacterium sp. MSK222]
MVAEKMEDELKKSLEFNDSLQDQGAERKRLVQNILLVIALAAFYVGMTVFAEVMHPVAFLIFYFVLIGLLVWALLHYQNKVRTSYRQDPYTQPKVDKKYYAGMAVILVPMFVTNMLREHTWALVIFVVLWAAAMVWVLQSRALDVAARQGEGRSAQ